ncbi:uncharacterized protein [Arachis hypogaea]|uniref:uncharacterized protein isoform X2 n=1 Tax=Arachis hypogaea TaxID=3818 RepID=UPI003B2224D1
MSLQIFLLTFSLRPVVILKKLILITTKCYDRSDYDDDTCNVAEVNWDDDDDDDGKKKEEDVVFGTSYCDEEDEVLQEQHPTRSFVSFASNQESLDEMEKNRLFWEACLAS